MGEFNKITTIRLRESTKMRLKAFKNVYGTYEKAVIALMDSFEGKDSDGEEQA